MHSMITRRKAQTHRGGRSSPELKYDPERSTNYSSLHTVVDMEDHGALTLRAAKFSFAPNVEPYTPPPKYEPPVTAGSAMRAASKKRREGLRLGRMGLGKDGAKSRLKPYSDSQLQNVWDATAEYKGRAARKLGHSLFERGADVTQLVKPWERADVWRAWLTVTNDTNVSSSVLVGSSGVGGSSGGSRHGSGGKKGKRGKGGGTRGHGSSMSNDSTTLFDDGPSYGDRDGGGATSARDGDDDDRKSDASPVEGGSSSSSSASDGGGRLNRAQFVAAVRALLGVSALSKKDAGELFNVLDAKRSGSVSIAAVASGMKKLADDAAKAVPGAPGTMEALMAHGAESPEAKIKAAAAEKAAEVEKAKREEQEKAIAQEAATRKQQEEKEEEARKQLEMQAAAMDAMGRVREAASDTGSEYAAGGRRRRKADTSDFGSGSSEFPNAEAVRRFFMAPVGPSTAGDESKVQLL